MAKPAPESAAPLPSPPPPPCDGRRRRSDATRRRVSGALFDLVRETATLPDAEAVARRAGVSRRTVFRYFDGSAALEVEVAQVLAALLREELPPPPPPAGPIALRLGAFLDHRCAVYRRGAALRQLIEASRRRGVPELDAFVAGMVAQMRAQLVSMLPELAAPGTPPEALTAFEVATGWDSWHGLSAMLALPEAEVRERLDWLARAVLARAGLIA